MVTGTAHEATAFAGTHMESFGNSLHVQALAWTIDAHGTLAIWVSLAIVASTIYLPTIITKVATWLWKKPPT